MLKNKLRGKEIELPEPLRREDYQDNIKVNHN